MVKINHDMKEAVAASDDLPVYTALCKEKAHTNISRIRMDFAVLTSIWYAFVYMYKVKHFASVLGKLDSSQQKNGHRSWVGFMLINGPCRTKTRASGRQRL